MVTLLGVMVAIVTIFIAVAAFWGYNGLKDAVRTMAKKEVAKAILQRLDEYPDSKDIFRAIQEIKEHTEMIQMMQNRIATVQENGKHADELDASNDKMRSSEDNEDNEESSKTPLENPNTQLTAIKPYPGEVADDADDSSK